MVGSPGSGAGVDSSSSAYSVREWSSSSSATLVDDGRSSPARRDDVSPALEPWQLRKAEERARLVRALPLRAEDEVLRVQYFNLKKRVAELEAREAQRLLSERKVTRRSRRRSGNGQPTASKKCRSAEDVWFTTLAEVSVNPAWDAATAVKAEGEDDGLDALTQKLFVDALEDDSGGGEMFG